MKFIAIQIASKPKRIRFKDDNSYTKRLLITHIITSIILFLSTLFHLVAICTNEWFYLNANGYNSMKAFEHIHRRHCHHHHHHLLSFIFTAISNLKHALETRTNEWLVFYRTRLPPSPCYERYEWLTLLLDC